MATSFTVFQTSLIYVQGDQCPVYATVHAYTGKATFFKVLEKHDHV